MAEILEAPIDFDTVMVKYTIGLNRKYHQIRKKNMYKIYMKKTEKPK
jgi:hypothetical protein